MTSTLLNERTVESLTDECSLLKRRFLNQVVLEEGQNNNETSGNILMTSSQDQEETFLAYVQKDKSTGKHLS